MYRFYEFVENFCESEKFRLVNFIPVCLGTGICWYFCLDNEPSMFLSIGMFISALMILLFTKTKISWGVFFIAFGFFLAQLRTISIDTRLLKEESKEPISFFATVETCNHTEKGLNFIVKDVSSLDVDKLFLIWRGTKALNTKQDYAPGDRVSFFSILSPLSNQAFPEHYDFKKQQYFNHISARGFIVSEPRKVHSAKTDSSLSTQIEKIRHKINKQIDENIEKNSAAVAKAIITGTKSAIPQKIREAFIKSGTAHILAISGLHIGIIGFFIFLLFRWILCCIPLISMYYNVKKIAAVFSFIGVFAYYLLSGCSVSSLRALIMHGIIIAGILIDRRALTMRSVAIAAMIILLISPEVIMFPSFQLSFSAVIAIIAFYEHHWHESSAIRMLFNVIITTVIASLATSIFSVFVFNQLTLNSIFANIFAIPLMTFFIMPAAVLSLAFLFFGISFPLNILSFGIDLLLKLISFSATLPGSLFVMPEPSPTTMTIVIFSALIFTLIHHKIRMLGVVGIFVGIFCYFTEERPKIVISPNAKAFGVKVSDDLVCFNHCGYFRGMLEAWTKSVGCSCRENFKSKSCRKFVKQINDHAVKATIDGNDYLLTYRNANFSSPVIFLDKTNDMLREIYVPSLREVSNRRKKRPWNFQEK